MAISRLVVLWLDCRGYERRLVLCLLKTSYVVNGKNRCPQGREMHFNGVY